MRQSLLARLLLFTLLFLLLLMAAVGYVLDTVYRQGQVQDWQQQMKIHSYNLLALLDQNNGQLVLPKQLPDQRFNQQDSGLYAVIERDDQTVWRAPSTIGLGRFSSGWSSAGDWQFSRASNGEQELLVARFGFDWMSANTVGGVVTYNLVFAENSHRLDQQAFAFRQQLWSLLAEIVVALMVLQVLILTLGLRPLRRMSDELTRLERGQQAALSDDYPRELRPLISNFNRVLSSEQAQRERYRNTVADVSHSLKTPLSVLGGMLPKLSLPEQQQQEVQQQLQRMADTVQYQLQRATTGSRISAAQRIAVNPILDSVISALKKVYADKQISWQLKCDDGCFFYGDDNDLMEIVGNLIDNACKYGRHSVHITLKKSQQYCTLTVDDDGVGVPTEHHEQIMRRGVRLDSQQPGQGFGLALVKDILDAYQAQLTISQSSLGGASFSVRWKGGSPVAEYKYKILQIILVACVMVGLSACSSVTVRPYGGEKDTTEPDYKASKSFYLGWLIGEHEVNVSEICGDRRVMQMQTVNSLSDLMQSFLSVLIYTPRTAKVWCEESGAGETDG